MGSGTLLLDEVADLPLDLQAKLLRVLEDGEFYRLGETQPRHSSARVLAATNKDIIKAIQTGLFREDLYHRLSVLTLRVPSLHERAGDKLLLLDYFKRKVGDQIATFQLDKGALDFWNEYAFPGNVRELRNLVQRAVILAGNSTILPDYIMFEHEHALLSQGLDSQAKDYNSHSSRLTRQQVISALEQCDGHRSKAAQLLNVSERTIYRHIKNV